jgi:hypothetical protein
VCVSVAVSAKEAEEKGKMISYRKTFQGAWELSGFVARWDNLAGDWLTRQYFGYTKKEATRLFREELKKIKGKSK